MSLRTVTLACALLSVSACLPKDDVPPHIPPNTTGTTTGVVTDTDTDTDGCVAGNCNECELPHDPCDAGTTDEFIAFGLTCPDRGIVDPTFAGSLGAKGVVTGLGNGPAYQPREGERYTVLGTGAVSELTAAGVCSTAFDGMTGSPNLPPPMNIQPVDPTYTKTCTDDPSLVGMGDCSNTIFDQFSQGMNQFDLAGIRFVTTVPDDATGVKFDFAFLSTEYPEFFGQPYNDMFVAWLESENWTGNVAFDDEGRPISLNAGFLDYRDDNVGLQQFAGTCMAGHAGTRWLTSSASVTPGEEITMIFAVFDMSDAILDSFVLLDNFRWGCDEGGGGPNTVPGETETDGTGSTGTTGTGSTTGP